MPLSPGSRLGPYEVVTSIGAGGMGEVYRARDLQLDRDVALKVLPDAVADDHERLHRFEREAKSLAALNHPNIAQVYGLVTTADRRAPAIAMELVEGRALDAVTGPLPLEELLPIARQIAAALEAAHDTGIVHRDLKPANVKVRDDGTVKVLDFGLAKAFDPGGAGSDASGGATITSPATGLGVILGTAAYMSPEQARGRAVDRRADIWAFGVVVFELLTGSRLFEGDTVSDTIAAVLRQDIPWSRLPASTPSGLQRLLRHCLERDPRQRLKDAGDIRIEIDDLAGSRDEPAAAAAAALEAPRSRRAPERLAWVALVAGGIGLGWWLGGARSVSDGPAWSHFTQLTDEGGREVTPAVAPDGSAIAYATDVSGSWDVYVRRIGGRNPTPVAADPARAEAAPAFSPDGRSIAFHEADQTGGIFVVGATGESERRVADVGFHPAWSPDGRFIAFCQERILTPASRVIVSALSIVNVATGEIRVVTEGDAVQPAWSPSGTRLAYWANNAGQRDIYTIEIGGGDPVQVTDDPALDWSVTWAPDGRHLYFASDRGGAMNLWRVAVDERTGRATGRPEPVTSGVQTTIATPSFSADGRRLVFSSSTSTTNPVALPVDLAGNRFGDPQFLFRQNGTFTPTSTSPDGAMLTYHGVSNQEDVWVGRADGSQLRRLTDDAHRDRVPMWSPDADAIAFYSNRSGKYEVWIIKPDGSGLTQLSSRPQDSLNWAFWDPAGRRVWAWSSTGAESYAFPVGQGVPQEGLKMPAIVVEDGRLRPHAITRDGRRVTGIVLSSAGARPGVGWHDLDSGKTWVWREGTDFGLPAWLDDRRIVFGLDGRFVVVLDTATRRQIVGGPFPFEVGLAALPAVSPDGRTVFISGGTNEADVWMAER